MKKILYYLLALIVVAIMLVVLFFDTLAKSSIESYIQGELKTPVHIAEFRSDWVRGRVNLDFVEVKNPDSFKNENAFVLNHLSALVSDQSADDLLILEYLEFDGLLFTLEQNNKQVNLVSLLNRLDDSVKSNNAYRSDGKISKSTYASPQQQKTKVIIKNLSFINTQLHIDTEWFNETVIVPDVTIYDFGANNGIPVDQVGVELLKIALGRIQKEVENKGFRLNEKEIKQGIKRKLDNKLEDLKGKLNNKAKDWFKKLGL